MCQQILGSGSKIVNVTPGFRKGKEPQKDLRPPHTLLYTTLGASKAKDTQTETRNHKGEDISARRPRNRRNGGVWVCKGSRVCMMHDGRWNPEAERCGGSGRRQRAAAAGGGSGRRSVGRSVALDSLLLFPLQAGIEMPRKRADEMMTRTAELHEQNKMLAELWLSGWRDDEEEEEEDEEIAMNLNLALRRAVNYQDPTDAPISVCWSMDVHGRPTIGTLRTLESLGAWNLEGLEFTDRSGRHWRSIGDPGDPDLASDDVDRSTEMRWGLARGIGCDTSMFFNGHGRGLPDEATVAAMVARGLVLPERGLEWRDRYLRNSTFPIFAGSNFCHAHVWRRVGPGRWTMIGS